jgi:hypothetical protein
MRQPETEIREKSEFQVLSRQNFGPRSEPRPPWKRTGLSIFRALSAKKYLGREKNCLEQQDYKMIKIQSSKRQISSGGESAGLAKGN